jgi:hypothetical protein
VVGPWVYNAVGEQNTPLQSIVLEISLGYFVFDLIVWCITIENESTIMLVRWYPATLVHDRCVVKQKSHFRSKQLHHIASITSCACGLGLQASGAELVGSLFVAGIALSIFTREHLKSTDACAWRGKR